MTIDNKTYKKIMEQGKEVFEILEQYDKTREWPLGRVRIDITLSKKSQEEKVDQRSILSYFN